MPQTPGVAVEIVGSIGTLQSSMQNAATAVEAAVNRMTVAFEKIATQSGAARAKVVQNTEQLATASEGMGRRFEHVGISVAFAANALGEGSERGVTRALHAIAGLGFAFGPVVGSIVTSLAILTENMVRMFTKTAEETKKAREQFESEVGKLANAGQSADLQSKLRALTFGTPFDEKGNLREKSALVSGAFKGSLLDLEATFRQTQAGLSSSLLGAALAQISEIPKPLKEAREQAEKLHEAILNIANQPATMGQLAVISTAQKPLSLDEQMKQITDAARLATETTDAAGAGIDKMLDDWRKKQVETAREQQKAADDTHWALIKSSAESTEMVIHDLQKIQQKNDETWRRVGEEGAAAAKKIADQWRNVFDSIPEAMQKAVSDMRGQWTGWGVFFRTTMLELTAMAVAAEYKILSAHLASWLAKKAITLNGVASEVAAITAGTIVAVAQYAIQGAAAAWAAIAAIPVVGPFLAPAIALGTLAGILALAHGGGSGGGGGSAGSASASGGGGGGTVNVHVHTNDAAGVAQWAQRNKAAIGAAAMSYMKDGGSARDEPGRRT